MTYKSDRKLLVLSAIICITIFYISTIREGHRWNCDFVQYIAHGENLLAGKSYEMTGYIFNPFNPAIGPPAYPPIFSLILSAGYKIYGLNLFALKVVIILFFLAFLLTIYVLFREYLPLEYLFATIIIIGFNPFFWDSKDIILAEFPFMFLTYLSFYLVELFYKNSTTRKPVICLFAITFSICLAYGTRWIGIVLAPSFIILDLIKNRKITAISIATLVSFVGYSLIQDYFTKTSSFVSYQIPLLNYQTILQNITIYPKSLYNFFDIGYRKTPLGASLIIITNIILSFFAVIGYWIKLKKISLFDIAPIFYMIVLILYPINQDLRFIMPIFPLYIFYSFYGLNNLEFINIPKLKEIIFIIIIALIIIPYGVFYKTTNYGPFNEGISTRETIEMLGYIKEHTRTDDVIIFHEPRVINFLTGRRSSGYHYPAEDEDLWRYFKEINAAYLVIGLEDGVYIAAFISRHQGKFRKIFDNHSYEIFLIKGD